MADVRRFALLPFLTASISALAQTWTPIGPLHTNPAFPRTNDQSGTIAVDTDGRWMALWEGVESSGRDIFGVSLTDLSPTWGPVRRVNGNFAGVNNDDRPQIAVSGSRWIAVWESSDSLGNTIGTDKDILYTTSTNAGMTWSSPSVLNSYAGTDLSTDSNPVVAAGQNGAVVVAWSTDHDFSGSVRADLDIAYAVSADGGLTFGTASTVESAAVDQLIDSDQLPAIATDGAGGWIICWQSFAALGQFGSDYDILYVRSTDDGTTWSSTDALNPNAATDGGASDQVPSIASDTQGTWLAVWESGNDLSGTIGTDLDILFSRSSDGGVTWTSPAPVNTTAFVPSIGRDDSARVTTDTLGNFLVVWLSADAPSGQTFNNTVVSSVTSDGGITWTEPTPLIAGAQGQFLPAVAMSRQGIATALWNSTGEFYGRTAIGGSIEGIITNGGGPFSCAVVEVTSSDENVQRVVAVDGQGHYSIHGLPEDSYNVSAYAQGIGVHNIPVEVVTDFTVPVNISLPSNPSANYHVTGFVTDEATGEGLIGARLVADLNGQPFINVLTCASGYFEMWFTLASNVMLDSLTASISAQSYENSSEVFNFSLGENTFNPTLKKSVTDTGVLSGFVTASDSNAAVAGATVMAVGNTSQTTTTAGDGQYTFDALATGVYEISIGSTGFVTTRIDRVAVRTNVLNTIDASLSPEAEQGTVTMTLSPSLAVSEGAGWRFAGELDWRYSATSADAVGMATVEFRPLDGWVSPAVESISVPPSGAVSPTRTYRRAADVNADGSINAVDVQATINTALGVSSFPADVNGDGSVNAVDIQLVINSVLGLD